MHYHRTYSSPDTRNERDTGNLGRRKVPSRRPRSHQRHENSINRVAGCRLENTNGFVNFLRRRGAARRRETGSATTGLEVSSATTTDKKFSVFAVSQ